MKIKQLYLKNFKSFKEETITFPNSGLCALVGENNGGKSNILSALNLILGEKYPMPNSFSDNDFYGWSKNKNLIIQVDFDENNLGYESVKLQYDTSVDPPKFDHKLKKNGYWGNYSPRSEDREKFGLVFIGSERDLLYQLSYSGWTLFGKVANELQKSFQGSSDFQVKEAKVKENFEKTIDILRENSQLQEFEKNLETNFQNLFAEGKVELKFKAFDPVNYFQTLFLSITEFNRDIYPRDLGTGSRNLLFLALFKAYAETFKPEGDLIIIEEPELFLHFAWRSYLYDVFEELVARGAQVIYATHSEDFVDLGRFDEVRIVRKINTSGEFCSEVLEPNTELVVEERKKEFPDTNLEQIKEHLVKLGSIEQSARKGFFAQKTILVEGPTESLSIPIFAQAASYDLEKNGIVVVDCSGKNNIPSFLDIYRSFGLKPYVIWDSDSHRPSGERGEGTNKKLSNCCFKQEIAQPSFQQNESGTVWGKDFEDKLKEEISDYDNLIEEGAREWGYNANEDSSKQLKVKYVALACKKRNECPESIRNILKFLSEDELEAEKLEENLPKVASQETEPNTDIPF